MRDGVPRSGAQAVQAKPPPALQEGWGAKPRAAGAVTALATRIGGGSEACRAFALSEQTERLRA